MILVRTPLRVSLFGGGTDYPEWFTQHGGSVLGMGIRKYCYVGVKHMPPGQELEPGVPLKFRVQYSHVDNTTRAEDVRHPAVRGALKHYGIETPLEFHTFGDLAGNSGLGGSSAFTVGLLHALQKLLGIPYLSQVQLAREAITFERHAIPEVVGLQDQLFCAMGKLRLIEFPAQQPFNFKTLQIGGAAESYLASSLLMVFSGTMRNAHVMAAKQVARVGENFHILKALAAMPAFAEKILRGGSHYNAIGELLHQMWILKRSLDPEISSGPIDALYSRGLSLGALGGKLLGAGGGGFMLFFVPHEKQRQFVEGIGHAVTSFEIDNKGTTVIINDEEEK